MREYEALVEQRDEWLKYEAAVMATLRADLYNTSAKMFERQFEAADFIPGAISSVEKRARELIAQGMSPARAAAIASSKQTPEQKFQMLQGGKQKRA